MGRKCISLSLIMNVSVASLLTPQCLWVHLIPFSPHPNPSFMRVWQRVCPWALFCVCVCPHATMINSCFWTLPDYRGVFKPISNGSSLLGRPALLHLPTCTQGLPHTYIHIKMHMCILTWTHTHTHTHTHTRSSHNWGGYVILTQWCL